MFRVGLSAEMFPVAFSCARAVQTYLKLRQECLYVVAAFLQTRCKAE